MRNRRFARQGFTLIEMLVALSVFALAAMALIKLSAESTRTAALMEQRTLAGIVADRIAAETSLGLDLSPSGSVVMAGVQWGWVRTPIGTRDGIQIVAVNVIVDGQSVAQRFGHRVQP